jgi:4-hydroxybenzoate polyprenyltransferase
MRLDRPIGAWLLLLPCWWGLALARGLSVKNMALFAVGAVVMRGAGCVINDLWDRRIDRAVARTQDRPLAAGEVGLGAALLFLAALLGLGLGVLWLFPPLVLRLALGVMPIVVMYPAAKRVFCAPQLFLAFAFNWGALLGWATVRGRLDWPAVALYAAGIFWTLAYDTIYAHQDKRDDVKVGVKSLALTLGDRSRRWIAGFFGTTLVLLALAGAEAGMNAPFFMMLWVALAHALWQVISWRPDDDANSAQRFKSNRDFGLIVLAGMMLGRL